MQNKPAVGFWEAVTVGTVFISAKLFLSYQVILYHMAGSAAWAVPILESAIAAAALLLIATVLNQHPGKSIVEISEEMVGPYLNITLSAIFAVTLLLITGLVLRQFSERAVTGLYPNTPISFVALFFLAGMVIVNYLGFETIARVAVLSTPVMVLGLGVIIGLSIPFWSSGALFPLLGHGAAGIMRGTLSQTGFFTELFILGIVAPFLPAGKLRPIGLWTIGLSTLLLSTFIVVPLLVFDYPLVTELSLPIFETSRLLSLERFGERMEALFVPIWVLSGLIKLSIGLYGSAAVTAHALKLNDHRPLILPMAVFTMAIAFIPPNVPTVMALDQDLLRRYSFALVMVMFMPVLIISHLRAKKGRNEDKESS